MNKQEFIELFSKKADFLTSNELQIIKGYLEEKLPDREDMGDPEIFSHNMKLSFEAFRYLDTIEAERQISSIADSVNEIMNSPNEKIISEAFDNEKTPPSQGKKGDSHISENHVEKTHESSSAGFINKILQQKGALKYLYIIISFIALILLLPFIGFAAGICAALYLIPICTVILIWLIIMIIDATFALLGIVATSYGIANLFVTPPIGLIEIGLGTVLFSFMLAIWALNHQFASSVIPCACRTVTILLKKALTLIKEFAFGKEGAR